MTHVANITALVPWYGANRLNAERVGIELQGCVWVGVPCFGSATELRYITARTLLVADKHEHVVNLARVAGDPELGPQLYRRLRRRIFHPRELDTAQQFCIEVERSDGLFSAMKVPVVPLRWAEEYFVASWLGRSGCAGTVGEFRASLATRWDAGGGDSARRVRSAVTSLLAWRRVFSRCTFECLDVFEFLDRVKDEPGHGLYLDPPWPDGGDSYTHKFTPAMQRRLAERVAGFKHVRVVLRYGDHELIRELYPSPPWTWVMQASRDQDNATVSEALNINGPSYAAPGKETP